MSNALTARPSVRDPFRRSPDAAILGRGFDGTKPDHWAEFRRIVADLRAVGVKTWGCRGILEIMRHLSALRGGAGPEAFRTNNGVSGCLARRWRRDHPAAGVFFRLRLLAGGLRRRFLRQFKE